MSSERDWQDGYVCILCGEFVPPNEFIWFGNLGPSEYPLCGVCLSKSVGRAWTCIRCGQLVLGHEAPRPQGRDPLDYFCAQCRSSLSEVDSFSNIWLKVTDWRCIICWGRLRHPGHWRKYAGGPSQGRKIPDYYCARCYYTFVVDPKTGDAMKRHELLPHVLEWLRAEERRRKSRQRWEYRQKGKKSIDVGGSSRLRTKWPDLGPTPRYQRKREAVASKIFTPPSPYDELRDEEGLLPRKKYEEQPELTYMDDIVAGKELDEVRKSLIPPDSDWMSWIEWEATQTEIAKATGKSQPTISREKAQFVQRMRKEIWDKVLREK